jgi:hypothetical protein
MFDPTAKSTKNLIEKYKTLFEFAIKQQDNSSLSMDQKKRLESEFLMSALKLL